MDLQVFQALVRRWVVRAFGEDVANDRAERTHRFLEEALELAQATECTAAQAHALVVYVYGRETGKPGQEVGGVLLTLAALCAARDISMNVEAAAEISRVNRPETLEKIRLKQAAKRRDIPLGSPLPGQLDPDAWCPACRRVGRTIRITQSDDGLPGHLRCAQCSCVVGDRPVRENQQPSTLDDVSVPIGKHLQRMAKGTANPVLLSRWREMVQQEGYTHDCSEWLLDRTCQLCDGTPLREPGGGKRPRTHTSLDAVGTTGGKATVEQVHKAGGQS